MGSMCVGIFLILTLYSEFTLLSTKAYDPDVHLSYSDIAVDSTSNPSMMQVHIKASKTDPFRKGVHLYLAKTENKLCPVSGFRVSYRGGGGGGGENWDSTPPPPRICEIFLLLIREITTNCQ